MSFNYVGSAPLAGDTGERYFYALRRDDDGQLFIAKVDKASPTDVIQINRPGGTDGNYTDFQAGESFFEGRNPNIYYYLNNEGEVVLRVNTKYEYPDGTSSDHLPFGQNATGYVG